MSTKKTKKPETRKCPVCGKKFVPAINNQKYCSKSCKNKARVRGKKPALTEKIVLPKGKKVAPKKPCAKKDPKTVLHVFGHKDPLKIIAMALTVVMDMLCEINSNGTVKHIGK